MQINLSDEMIITLETLVTVLPAEKRSIMEVEAVEMIEEMAIDIHRSTRRWKAVVKQIADTNCGL